jgi:hypothetical protein
MLKVVWNEWDDEAVETATSNVINLFRSRELVQLDIDIEFD